MLKLAAFGSRGNRTAAVESGGAILVDWVENGLAPEKVVSPLRGGGVLHVRPWTPILRDESLLTSRFK